MGLARGRVRLTAMLSASFIAALLSGCGPSEKALPEDDPSKASADAIKIPVDALDPDHSVEAPGTFDGTQYGDDLLLVSNKTISPETLKKITAVRVGKKGTKLRKGVAAHTQLSLGQFSSENKLYNIAAVDPAEYRRFSGPRSAKFQQQWDRIAGGEVSVAVRLQKQLPIDGKGFVKVGKQSIHVASWEPEGVASVDAVVNEKWGDELGLPKDNAVLINTGIASPQAVREVIEKAFGKDTFSITALDIVASAGIDPGTFQSVVPVGAFGDAVGVFRYTPIGGGRIAPDPGWVKSHIVREQVPILGTVTCNKFMMPQLKAALAEVVSRGLAKEIHANEYAGCYYPRFIAGSSSLSNHSFGLALDFNVPGNQRGTVGEMNREVVQIFKYWGFAWGGDWGYTDPMHFELQRIVNPG